MAILITIPNSYSSRVVSYAIAKIEERISAFPHPYRKGYKVSMGEYLSITFPEEVDNELFDILTQSLIEESRKEIEEIQYQTMSYHPLF